MRWIIVLLLALGIFFRFVNLDHKVYWYDETFTSLRAAGYTEAEIVQHFANSPIIQTPDLQHYQRPAASRTLADTFHSLAIEDTQHPPLYYGVAHLWMRSVGSSVTAMRLLPACLSLLALPCVYWLCWELFAVPGTMLGSQVGWMAMGVLAVSPFQVLYAQESRQYSLWSVTALLATASLLWAVRTRRTVSWVIYALSVAIALYTFLFSSFIVIAHGLYIGITTKGRWGQTVFAYGLATLTGLVLFLPWAWIVAHNLEQAHAVTQWTETRRTGLGLVTSWASILGRLFYDRGESLPDRLIQVGIIGLIGLSFYTLCRQTAQRVWLLVVILTIGPFLALALPDVFLGGLRSTFPRYLIPALSGVQIAVAYFLATKLDERRASCPAVWRWGVLVVLSLSVVSCLTISSAQVWWIKTHNHENLTVAQVINQTQDALVVSDAEMGDLLSLSYSVAPAVKWLIRPRCYTCHIKTVETVNPAIFAIPSRHTNIFLFHPRASKAWRRSLMNDPNYQFKPVFSDGNSGLWQVIRN